MTEAYIVDGVRTPFGKRNGMLKDVRPDDLAALTLKELAARTHLDTHAVEDVRLGCVTQVGEQGYNIGRLAPLIAGFPVEVPGTAVNRMCASSLETINQAAQAIKSDMHDVVIAAGVESMTRVPMGSDGSTFSDQLLAQYNIVPQGISAEMIAAQWHLTREELDEFSYQSHMRAVKAQSEHFFDKETFDVPVPAQGGGTLTVRQDEGPRADTTLERMATLRLPFKPDGVVTAGSSSQISDGASALLMVSENALRTHHFTPRARIVAMAVVGVDPVIMLTGPIPATRKVLNKAGLKFDDIDVFEINEAFASVVLAWGQEYRPDWAKVNPHGGAIALGHPLGASGGRLVLTALNQLEATNGHYGLITMCIGWGMAVATIIERL